MKNEWPILEDSPRYFRIKIWIQKSILMIDNVDAETCKENQLIIMFVINRLWAEESS